jgi:hypothetical protein
MASSPSVNAAQTTSRNRAIGRRREDLIYQVVTVAAMVSLLASTWVF